LSSEDEEEEEENNLIVHFPGTRGNPVNCLEEKCHHYRVIVYLKGLRMRKGIDFRAALMPYRDRQELALFGVRKGEPDFKIMYAYIDRRLPVVDPKTKKLVYHGLMIELKVGKGRLSRAEKEIFLKYKETGLYLTAVCYGWQSCVRLIKAYVEGKPLDIVEKLCWAGLTKKRHVYGKRFRKNSKIHKRPKKKRRTK